MILLHGDRGGGLQEEVSAADYSGFVPPSPRREASAGERTPAPPARIFRYSLRRWSQKDSERGVLRVDLGTYPPVHIRRAEGVYGLHVPSGPLPVYGSVGRGLVHLTTTVDDVLRPNGDAKVEGWHFRRGDSFCFREESGRNVYGE